MYPFTLSLSEQNNPPVSLNDAKDQLQIIDSSHDNYISKLIARATALIEMETNHDLRSSTWLWQGQFSRPMWYNPGYYDRFYTGEFLTGLHKRRLFLPRFPVTTVSSFQYYDADNTLQTLALNTDFYLMKPRNALAWIEPVVYLPPTFNRPDAVQITFISGDSTNLLGQQAILLAVGTWFENRESETQTNLKMLDLGFDRILDQLRANEVY